MDLFQISWRFEAWLNAFPLNRNTVLDYFKHSPFYDRLCNNEVVLQAQQSGADQQSSLKWAFAPQLQPSVLSRCITETSQESSTKWTARHRATSSIS